MNSINNSQKPYCRHVFINHLSVILLLLFVWIAAPSQSVDKTLFTGAAELALQIEKQLAKEGSTAIAVTEITDIEKRRSNLGRLLAEEITTKLIQSTKCRVVERALLDKVLKEKNWQHTDLFDPERLLEFGKFVGADAVIAGSYAVFANNVKINVRLIETETGQVIAAASTSIIKDKDVVILDESGPDGRVQHPIFEQSEPPPPPPKPKFPAGAVFYSEDFSAYEEGDIPKSWGNDMVKVLKARDGRKYLSMERRGSHEVSQSVQFPSNFTFEFDLLHSAGFEDMRFSFVEADGDLFTITIGENGYTWHVRLPDTDWGRMRFDDNYRPYHFTITKKDDLVKVWINGNYLISGRYESDTQITGFRTNLVWCARGYYIGRFLGKSLGD